MSPESFAEIHRAYSERLQRGVLSIVKNPSIAEEVVADTFAEAFQCMDNFAGRSTLYTWIYGIALNKIRAARRRAPALSVYDFVGKEYGPLVDSLEPSRAYEQKEICLRLRRALRKIPPLYRRPLIKHVVEHMQVKVIARREGVPIGTILRRIFTAKQVFRAAWSGLGPFRERRRRPRLSPGSNNLGFAA